MSVHRINSTPFGSPLPGRQYSASSYRYGFNGKENDKETVGTSNGTQDYGMRIYNPSLGRFLSVDPIGKDFPWYTPYQFAGNSPISNIDLDGLEDHFYKLTWDKTGGNPQLTLIKTEPDLIPGFLSGVYINGQYMGDALTNDGAKELAEHYGTFTKAQFEGYQASVKKSNEELKQKIEDDVEAFEEYVIYHNGVNTKKGTYTNTKKPSVTVTATKQTSTNNGIKLKNSTPQEGPDFVSFKTTIKDGKINIDGRAVTNGKFDFVITIDGKLVIGTGHYNLSNGASSVKAAGQLKIYKGQVMSINNSSGHYKPSVEEGESAIKALNDAGINTSGANVKLYSSDGKTIEKKFIAN